MVKTRALCVGAVPILGMLVVLSGQATTEPAGTANGALMDAAVTLIKVGRYDDAAKTLQRIMATNPSPEEALRLRDQAGTALLTSLMHHPTVGEPVSELLRLAFEAMKTNRVSPAYIQEMIGQLRTPQRPRAVAYLRLSGAYAVPAMIEVLQDPSRKALQPLVQAVLAQMPLDAAAAMVEGLRNPDVNVRAGLADALGQMGSRLAVAELKRMAEDQKLPQTVRVPVELALRKILGESAWSAKPAVEAYLELALALHQGDPWAFPAGAEPSLPLSTWDDAQGKLAYVEVPRTLYGPLTAERMAARAVAYWPTHEPLYPVRYLAKLGLLWEAQARPAAAHPAARIERELDLLAALMGDGRLVVGLKSALDRRDWRTALGFLRGLRLVASARTVVSDQTIASALSAADRRVQYEAAFTIVATDPQAVFQGSELVVPMLAEALSQAVPRVVVVITADTVAVNTFRGVVKEAGFAIEHVADARRGCDILTSGPGAEALLLDARVADPPLDTLLQNLRKDARTRRLPVLLLARTLEERDRLELGPVARYASVSVLPPGVEATAVRDALLAAIGEARGRALSPEEGLQLPQRAAQALLTLDLNHPVFSVSAAVPQAEAVLRGGAEDLRARAALLLARIGTPRCQKALAEVVLDQRTPLPLARAVLAALVDSVRRNGNALDAGQVTALSNLLDQGDPELTDLAARLMGLTGVPAKDLPEAYRRAGGL